MSKCHFFFGKIVSWLNFCTFAGCSSTHLSRMDFQLLSIGPIHFRFKGCWVVFIICIQILIEHLVDTLIRHRVLWRLIWVCTVSQWVKCYQFLCSLQCCKNQLHKNEKKMGFCFIYFNSFVSCEFCRLLMIFANGLEPDQAQQNVGPDRGPSRLTLL